MTTARDDAALLERADVARLARALAGRPSLQLEADDRVLARQAATALVLRPRTGDTLELLFIKRAEWAGDPWSGQVAFPGGRHEPRDPDLLATAVRETYEETGIDLAADGWLLGTLDEQRPRTAVLPPLTVRPHVFVARPDVSIVPSPEVARTFWIPLPTLLDPAASGEAEVLVRGAPLRVTCFFHEELIIWGLTERIIHDLIERWRGNTD